MHSSTDFIAYFLYNLPLVILSSFGFCALIRTSPLGKIEKKPFNCYICLSGWGGFTYSILLTYIELKLSFSNFTLSILHFCKYLDIYFSKCIIFTIISAGAMWILLKFYPNAPEIKDLPEIEYK